MPSDYLSLPTNSGGGSGQDTELRNKNVRSTRFIIIESATSGTLTPPQNAQIIEDDFGGETDCCITKDIGGKPTIEDAKTVGGDVVAASLDVDGNWALTEAPAAYPICLVYRVNQPFEDFDASDPDIWGPTQVNFSPLSRRVGKATLVAGAVTVLNASVTFDSLFLLTAQAEGNFVGSLKVANIVAGVSFDIISTFEDDTAVVVWEIIEP